MKKKKKKKKKKTALVKCQNVYDNIALHAIFFRQSNS